MNWKSKPLASLLTLAFFAVIAAGTAGSENGGKRSSENRDRSSGSPAPAKAEPVARTYVTESCFDLSTKFGAGSKMSDLQKEELWKDYKGKAFKWNLKVTEVSSGMLGGFNVQFKCAPKSPSFIQDVQVAYDKSDKAVVMGYNKDEVYEVEGELKLSMSLLGMTADAITQ